MSVNKVILIGHCCKDAEIRYMTNGEAVTNISIATNEKWKGKDGQKQERTEFHNLVFYRKLAEIAGEYLKKGSQVYVEGKLQTRKWQTKEGQDRYTTEIIVNEMTMLGGKQDGHDSDAPPPARPAPAAQPDAPASPAKTGSFENFDDDIPFMRHGHRGAGVCWRAM